jgi:predicted ATP-binding protein involved in virulence
MKNRINFLHDELFLFLENLKDTKNEVFKDLKYTFRKDNFSNKLENGFWFLGDENNLIISFWKGENIYTKKPNICLNFELDKELIYLEITIEKANYNLFVSSENKFRLIHDYLLPHLGEFESFEEKDFLVYRHRLGPIEFWNDILVNFIIGSKIRIDEAINNFHEQFENEDEQSRYSIGQIDKGQFRRNLLKIKQYRDQLAELNDYENASYYNRDRPFYLNSFEMKDYGHIDNMSINNIPLDNRWIFITGENGSGKTSLLKALAVFLGQGIISSNYNNVRNFKLPTFSANLIGTKGEIKEIKRIGNDSESRNAKRSLLRGFAAYGIHRTVIKSNYYTPKRNHELSKNGFLESILSDGITPLIDFNKTIEEWTESKNSLEKFFHRRDFFAKALLKTVPGLVDIHFTNSSKGLISDFFIRYDDGPVSKVSYGQLSSGTKSILSFVADIIVRFYKQQPEAFDPSEFKGIVIVDEIDLHLHPQGQKKIILALSEVFPNIQFIVSTHSPIPLLGAPKNSVICVVKRNIEKGTYLERVDDKIYFQDLLPNTILTSPIFNMDVITNIDRDKSKTIRTEKTFEELKFVDKLEMKINEFMTNEKEEQLIKLFESRRK